MRLCYYYIALQVDKETNMVSYSGSLDLATIKYYDGELEKINSFDVSMEELNLNHPIECISGVGTGARIAYCGDIGVLILMYDDGDIKQFDRAYILSLNKDCFSSL